MEYPKIHSLWKRKEFQKGLPKGSHGDLIPGEYACEEFGNIKEWELEEKIDGTNIRIFYKDGQVRFGGRTKDAQIPCHLLEYLQNTFTQSVLQARFSDLDIGCQVILFGEGYGPKIQTGGLYSAQPGFCLFDVRIGSWWLERDAMRGVATQLGVIHPPSFGVMTEGQIVDWIKSKPLSYFAQNDPKGQCVMEGVVCRPKKLMLFRNGDPIMFKLKCKEFI